jgi:hypothetical protein
MKVGKTILAVGHGLAVEHDFIGLENPHGFGHRQELPGLIPPVAAPEPNRLAALASDDPIAVVLDLVNPYRPARSLIRESGLAWFDETRRTMPLAGERGTHQHGWRRIGAIRLSPQGDSAPHLQASAD